MLEAAVREIGAEVLGLRRNYALWWAVANPEFRRSKEAAFRHFGAFFDASANAFFCSIVVGVYQLMDERDDVYSMPRLLDVAAQSHPQIRADFQERVRPIQDIYDRMAALRHKVLAHRDRTVAPDTVYELVQLRPESINACIAPLHDTADILFATFVSGYHPYVFWEEVDRVATGARNELHALVERAL